MPGSRVLVPCVKLFSSHNADSNVFWFFFFSFFFFFLNLLGKTDFIGALIVVILSVPKLNFLH